MKTEPGNGIKDNRDEKKVNIAERNQLTKIIQEINKLKKEIEQIDNKEVSLPQYNINFNNEKSMMNNDTFNGINLNNINNELNTNGNIGLYEDDNNMLINDINLNDNEFTNNRDEEELINHKNKIENLINNPNSLIMNRIEFYKNRCINIIGKKVFAKAYECIKNDKQNRINNNNIDYNLREKLTTILGKTNIGFWQMINQVLLLEDLLNQNKS